MSKPEHMKLTPEVRGLVEEIKAQIYKIDEWSKNNNVCASGLEVPLCMIERALKPFEKENSNDKD
jgi:hypothetical protein